MRILMIFLFAWCIIVIGCRVADRAVSNQTSTVHRYDSTAIKDSSTYASDSRTSQISAAGTTFFMDKIRTPFRPGESMAEYAAENSSRIIQYDYGRAATTEKTKATTSATATAINKSDSAGKKKDTDHKTDSTPGAGIPWYIWLLILSAIFFLLYLWLAKAEKK